MNGTGGEPTLDHRETQYYAAIRMTGTLAEIIGGLPNHWPQVTTWLTRNDASQTGAPFIRYLIVDMDGAKLEVDVGIPTADSLEGDAKVSTGSFPAGDYAVLIHVGHYDRLVAANTTLQRWVLDQGLQFARSGSEPEGVWQGRAESYLTDPQSEPDPSKWQTEIAYLLAEPKHSRLPSKSSTTKSRIP